MIFVSHGVSFFDTVGLLSAPFVRTSFGARSFSVTALKSPYQS